MVYKETLLALRASGKQLARTAQIYKDGKCTEYTIELTRLGAYDQNSDPSVTLAKLLVASEICSKEEDAQRHAKQFTIWASNYNTRSGQKCCNCNKRMLQSKDDAADIVFTDQTTIILK